MKAHCASASFLDIAAAPARFHIEAAVRIVLRVHEEYFVLLEYGEGDARVYESDRVGEIGWFPIVAAGSFALAISELGHLLGVSHSSLISAVGAIRAEQMRGRCASARTQAEVSGARAAPIKMDGVSSSTPARVACRIGPFAPRTGDRVTSEMPSTAGSRSFSGQLPSAPEAPRPWAEDRND